MSRQFLSDRTCCTLYPHDYSLIKRQDIEAGKRGSIVDVLFLIAETTDPEIVILRLVKAMLQLHLRVAKVTVTLVVDQASGHPIIYHLHLGSQMHQLFHMVVISSSSEDGINNSLSKALIYGEALTK